MKSSDHFLRGAGLFLLLALGSAVGTSGAQSQPKRLIISYEHSSRASIATYWENKLGPLGVELIRHSSADGLAILTGEPASLAQAVSQMPGVVMVEEDRIVRIQVGSTHVSLKLVFAGTKSPSI